MDLLKALKFVTPFAAKTDRRASLNGVHIWSRPGGVVLLEATTGHILGQVEIPVRMVCDIILNHEGLEQLIANLRAGMPDALALEWAVNWAHEHEVEGRYPYTDQAIPKSRTPVDLIGVDPALMSKALAPFKHITKGSVSMKFSGAEGGIVICAGDARAVVMPCRLGV